MQFFTWILKIRATFDSWNIDADTVFVLGYNYLQLWRVKTIFRR